MTLVHVPLEGFRFMAVTYAVVDEFNRNSVMHKLPLWLVHAPTTATGVYPLRATFICFSIVLPQATLLTLNENVFVLNNWDMEC